MKRLRRDRRLRVVIAGPIALGLLTGVMTDLIRLGLSELALPADAMSITLEILRRSDIDPDHDYYYLVATISNHVNDPSIQPYEADVTFRTNTEA